MSTVPNEVKIMSADGGALGLFGLGIATLLGSASFLGMTVAPFDAAWILGLTVLAHMIASFIGFKSNNIFGGTVFGAYGLFWFAIGIRTLMAGGFFGDGVKASIEAGAGTELAFVFLGYFVFSIIAFIASCYTNKLLMVVIGLIVLLFFGLAGSAFGIGATFFDFVANISRLLLCITCFYAVGAILLNTMLDKEVWPVGSK